MLQHFGSQRQLLVEHRAQAAFSILAAIVQVLFAWTGMADLFDDTDELPMCRWSPRTEDVIDGHPMYAPLASFEAPSPYVAREVYYCADPESSPKTLYVWEDATKMDKPPAGEMYLRPQKPGQAMFRNMTGHEVVAAVFWQRRAALMWWKNYAQPGQAMIQAYWRRVVNLLGFMVGVLPISLLTCRRDQMRAQHYWVTEGLALWGQPESWQVRVKLPKWRPPRDQGRWRLGDKPLVPEVSDPEEEQQNITRSIRKCKQYRRKWGKSLDRLLPDPDVELWM